MVELDRLRAVAEDIGRSEWGEELGTALLEIANAIEREVYDISGYESDVLAWVERNGGLEAVKECTMPEGMSWPLYEDGEPVRLGDHWHQDGYDWSITSIDSIGFAEDGVRFENEYADAFYRYGERVKRPAPPVLDADGVEVKVGDDLYSVEGMLKFHVSAIDRKGSRIATEAMFALDKWADPKMYTHRAHVLAADGEPLEVGQTVYVIATGKTHHVTEVDAVSKRFRSMEQVDDSHWLDPMCFTHQRPVLDADGVPIKKGDTVWLTGEPEYSWTVTYVSERHVGGYCNEDGSDLDMHSKSLTHTKPEPDTWDSVWMDVSNGCETPLGMERRCKALAERGE